MGSEQANLEIVDDTDDALVARVAGDLDILTSDQVKAELSERADGGVRTLVLDLADVGFVDSSGLGALVTLHRHVEARGGRFVLRSVPPPVQRLFEITRLDDLLVVEGS
jgi:anti-anti-sigma factor